MSQGFLPAGIWYAATPPTSGDETYYPFGGATINDVTGLKWLRLVVQMLYHTRIWSLPFSITASGQASSTSGAITSTVEWSISITDAITLNAEKPTQGAPASTDEFIAPADRDGVTDPFWMGVAGDTYLVGTASWTRTITEEGEDPIVDNESEDVNIEALIEWAEDPATSTTKSFLVNAADIYPRFRLVTTFTAGDPFSIFQSGFQLLFTLDTASSGVDTSVVTITGNDGVSTCNGQVSSTADDDTNLVSGWTLDSHSYAITTGLQSDTDFSY